jgi:cytochrome oxidase assembly protein ShyY1
MQVMFSRRWLTALLVAIAFAVACVFLGRWQWHRHDAKVARADRINSHFYARPVPLRSALPTTGETLPRSEEWTKVTATGTYADGNLQLVRNRPNAGVSGYEVAVPLDLPGGASLLVDRGWVLNANQAAERPDVPATPRGTITVTGWLRVGEPSLGRQLPPGQLASINLPEARRATGADLYGTYLILDREVGSPGQTIARPTRLEPPDTDLGPHLAYAVQWWLAAPAGIVLVFVGARREWREDRLEDDLAAGRTPVPVRARKVRIWDEEDA